MIKSANQQYKESGSEMPFKDWLQTQQQVGKLADHEKMFSADGETEEVKKEKPTLKKAKVDLAKWNYLAIVSVVSLIYGLIKVSNQSSNEGSGEVEMQPATPTTSE